MGTVWEKMFAAIALPTCVCAGLIVRHTACVLKSRLKVLKSGNEHEITAKRNSVMYSVAEESPSAVIYM